MSTFEGRECERLLRALHLLFGLDVTDLERALDAAARQVAGVMGADKVDVFLLEPQTDTLVAVGTNDAPMAQKQKALGLDRLPLEVGGHSVAVFLSGESRLSRHLDQDPEELRGIVEDLGVRSQIAVPLDVRGKRSGVMMVCSARPEYFSGDDLRFVETIAQWVGLVGYRAAAVQQAIEEAARQALRIAAEDTVAKLTPRQREVAVLVAAGLTNMEIAQRLVLTPGTVANHVESILRRLGFRSRTQVAALLGDPNLARPEASGPEGSSER
jgi:DNA-binding CsgD family transcriptional regulator